MEKLLSQEEIDALLDAISNNTNCLSKSHVL